MNQYMKENIKWITPVLGMFFVVMSPVLAAMSGAPLPIPSWLVPAAIGMGMLGAGYGAAITDTMSARIVRFVIPALLLSIVAFKIFG